MPRPLCRCVLAIPAPLAIAALLLAGGCAKKPTEWDATKTGPKVVASFAPISSLVQSIAGPDAQVQTVLTSQGPHGGEVDGGKAALLRRADLFFANGLGLDDGVVEKLRKAAGGAELKVVSLGDAIDKRFLEETAHDHDHEAPAGGGGHGHQHGAKDPHVWLGLAPATAMTEVIERELVAKDPAHAAGYRERGGALRARLAKLQADGKALLAGKKERGIVSFHESLGYFAKSFDLEIEAVIEKTPGTEPSAKDLQNLVAECLEHKVRVIAVEPQYSAKSSAKRLVDELKARGVADAELVELDPMETADPAKLNAEFYEATMRANLEALAKVLR